MGLLIGSPTNIIVSLNAGINFADYFLLMLVPSVLAIGISFLVLQFINVYFYKWIATFTNLDWGHEPNYTMPALSVQPNFTSEMRNWVLFFILVIIAVAVVSHFQWSFFWVTIPTMAFGLVGVYVSSGGVDNVSEASPAARNIGSADRRKSAVVDCLESLPYSIIAFALVFFVIADVLAREVSLSEILESIIRLPVFLNAVVSMFGTAALVNTVNDLPASAIIGEAVGSYPGAHSLRYTVFLQSSLAALNIACYITPIGALAGIIWFHIMRRDAGDADIRTPTRTGMVVYGSLHFVLSTLILSVFIPGMNIGRQWILGLSESGFDNIGVAELKAMVVAGIFLLISMGVLLAYVLGNHKIFLGDMRAFLTASSWLHVRSRRGGLLSRVLIALLVVAMFGWLIRIAEGQLYVDSPFDSSVDFVVWVLVFLGSGFEGGWFPQSPLARMLTGLMPLAAIFLIIYLIQVTRQTTPLEQISRRIARGEIITRRSVILDYRAWMRIFVEQIWTDKDSSMFQTVLYTDQFPPPEWNEERDYDAIYARSVSLDDEENLRIVVDEYRLERCDEVYLLSDRFCGEEGVRQAAIVINQIAANLKRYPTTELGEQRFRTLNLTDDPEDHAGRLPRIFLWADVRVDNIIDPQMLNLLIKLPEHRRSLERDIRLQPVVRTMYEKSWRTRRQLIQCFGSSESP